MLKIYLFRITPTRIICMFSISNGYGNTEIIEIVENCMENYNNLNNTRDDYIKIMLYSLTT